LKLSQHDPLCWIDEELRALDEAGLRRAPRTRQGPQQVRIRMYGRELINFGSNDYLGLADDARLREAAAQAVAESGCGAGASPLVTGHSAAQQRLEERLAEFAAAPSALVFPSGYAANVGTIAALVGRGDAVYSDEKNHASMIDGCRLSRAAVHVYPHGDASALAEMLSQGTAYRRRLIVSESVFSMDGDRAPLAELAALAARHDCMVLVDEAHAVGVFGSHGRGLAEEMGVEEGIHIRIGTLGKALGSAGGFACGSRPLIDWLVNRARSYVYSTALPPSVCAAALAALDVVRDEPWRREQLAKRAADLASGLRAKGWNIGSSTSQIIPIVVGKAADAVDLAERLVDRGLLVPAIRPPTVPSGRALLRVSVGCAHTPEMIERLIQALGCVASVGGGI
jgi:8-amino-7-oxononanoate synthase